MDRPFESIVVPTGPEKGSVFTQTLSLLSELLSSKALIFWQEGWAPLPDTLTLGDDRVASTCSVEGFLFLESWAA